MDRIGNKSNNRTFSNTFVMQTKELVAAISVYRPECWRVLSSLSGCHDRLPS